MTIEGERERTMVGMQEEENEASGRLKGNGRHFVLLGQGELQFASGATADLFFCVVGMPDATYRGLARNCPGWNAQKGGWAGLQNEVAGGLGVGCRGSCLYS